MSDIKLERFNKLTVKIEYKEIIDKYSEQCARYLKATSPKRNFARKNKYAQGWEVKEMDVAKSQKGKYYNVHVWNKTNYRLTHLLENGHLITNKRNGVGWASARPHIDKAYQYVRSPFIYAMEKAKMDVDIK